MKDYYDGFLITDKLCEALNKADQLIDPNRKGTSDVNVVVLALEAYLETMGLYYKVEDKEVKDYSN